MTQLTGTECALVAVPIVRGRRKVKVERKDGTVEERDAADVVAALIEQQGLYAALREGVLPLEVQARRAAGLPDLCATCGGALSMSRNAIRCRSCRYTDPSQWTCRTCAKRKTASAITTEQRRANARTALSAMTPEQLRERALKANAARTPDQRQAASRKAHETITPERRRELSIKAQASITPEQRRANGRKGALAREARRATKAST